MLNIDFTLNLVEIMYCMIFEKLRKTGERETHNKKKRKEEKRKRKRVQYDMKKLKSMKREFEVHIY